jgi:hypothetical protein
MAPGVPPPPFRQGSLVRSEVHPDGPGAKGLVLRIVRKLPHHEQCLPRISPGVVHIGEMFS